MNERVMNKILKEGYELFETCYYTDEDVVEKAKNRGYKSVISYRVKSDTPYVKMFAVLVK